MEIWNRHFECMSRNELKKIQEKDFGKQLSGFILMFLITGIGYRKQVLVLKTFSVLRISPGFPIQARTIFG